MLLWIVIQYEASLHNITNINYAVQNMSIQWRHSWGSNLHQMNWNLLEYLPPATKLGQGYIFTGICHSVNRGGAWFRGGAWSWGGLLSGGAWSGGCLVLGRSAPGGVPGPRGGRFLLWGVSAPRGCLVETPPMATAAGSTHPTGMHSCLNCNRFKYYSCGKIVSFQQMHLVEDTQNVA